MSQDKSKLKCFEFLSPLSQKEITKAFREKDKEIEELKIILKHSKKWCDDIYDKNQELQAQLSRVTVEGIANILSGKTIINEGILATAIYKMIRGEK